LIDAQPPERRPERMLGDTAYGNGPVRAELAEREVEVLAPVPEGKIEESVLGKHDFAIDMTAGAVTCPAGQTVPISVSKTGFRQANFARAMCRDCPLKPLCCPNKTRRQIRIMQHEHHLQSGRRALSDPILSEHLRRTRPRIERLLGLTSHRYGTRKSRYIGSAKTRLQAAWAAALVNLNPIGHRLISQNT
jgi:Transposase DDE domain